ncbi:hypothetical protein ACFYPG_31345 [Micromonospora sp. NPDC005553]|uniref:hypothetical protein n=1 Tax=unclassified Micromonospora TaxID=2617518 RepID=UPI0033A3CDC6
MLRVGSHTTAVVSDFGSRAGLLLSRLTGVQHLRHRARRPDLRGAAEPDAGLLASMIGLAMLLVNLSAYLAFRRKINDPGRNLRA